MYSASLAQTGEGEAIVAVVSNPPAITARKFCLDVVGVDDETTGVLLLLLADLNPNASQLKHAAISRLTANKIRVPMGDFIIK